MLLAMMLCSGLVFSLPSMANVEKPSANTLPPTLSAKVLYGQSIEDQIASARIQAQQSEANFDKGNFIMGVSKLALLYDIRQFNDSALYYSERALALYADSCNVLKVRLLGIALRSSSALMDQQKVDQYLLSLSGCLKKQAALGSEISFQKALYHLQIHQYPALSEELLNAEYSGHKQSDIELNLPLLLLKGRFFQLAGAYDAALNTTQQFFSEQSNDSNSILYAFGKKLESEIYLSMNQLTKAEEGLEFCLGRFEQLGVQGALTQTLITLSHINCVQGNYLSAESYLFRANTVLQEANGSLGHLLPSFLRARAYLQMGLFKTEAAGNLALQALGLADASGNQLESYRIRDFLALLSEKTGQFDQALTYRKSADHVLNSLGISTAYASYVSQEQARMKSETAPVRSIPTEVPGSSNPFNGTSGYITLSALLLLLFVIGFLIARNQVKQKNNRELQSKNEVIVNQNKELLITNEQLNEARLKAEEASVAKSNFLAITIHEIRTPLNGIMGMASLLSETQLDPTQKNYVDTIVKSSENLLIILNDILDFSKLESGKVSLEVKLIDLERLLDEVRTIFAKQAQERNITITRKIGNAGIKFFRGDILRIRQVLINLVSNAVKFTENGTVKIIVDLEELNKEGDDEHNRNAILRFSVQDDGIGISPEKQQIIFESFEQEDSSTSRKFGGIGLGLSISKKLVELMGGSIGLQSQKNVGTTFYFSLPVIIPDITNKLNEEPVNAAVREEDSALKDILLSERYPMRILMAEDNMFNKLFIEKLLEKFGYEEFLHAENGHQVMDMLAKESVDLILMDIQMPGKDGIETTKEIIAKYGEKRPVIVAVTADSNDSNKEYYLNAGMDAFLSKPFKEKDLRGILEKYGQRISSGKSPFKRIIP